MTKDPLLTTPLNPSYPTGYNVFIQNWRQIIDAAVTWYREAHDGKEPADTDIGHGVWRGLNEGPRWGTLANAWQNTWPLPNPPTPGWRPTRTQILQSNGSYCSRRDNEGRVIFEPFIGRLWLDGNMKAVDEWVTLALEISGSESTNFVVMPQSNKYHQYYLDGFDFTGNEGAFRDLLSYLLSRKVIPRVFLTSGDTPAEIANVRPRAEAYQDFKDACIWYHGWETIGSRNPTYTSKQWYDAQMLMRDVFGKNAVLGMHVADSARCTWASMRGDNINEPVPGCHWVPKPDEPGKGVWIEDDDPSGGDEVHAMRMIQIDVFSIQTPHGSKGPSGTLGDLNDTETWSGHFVEIADRFLPPGSVIPGLGRLVTGPDWFQGDGITRPVFDGMETICYEYSRDQVSESWAKAVSRRVAETGVGMQGCYRP